MVLKNKLGLDTKTGAKPGIITHANSLAVDRTPMRYLGFYSATVIRRFTKVDKVPAKFLNKMSP